MQAKSLAVYVDDIAASNGFDTQSIIVEHRSNNPKRDFLFVNKNQCKHIPCSPKNTIEMINTLSDIVARGTDKYKSILVIAFAETATALGNLLADRLLSCAAVMQTTRESIPGTHCILTFEEEHSHATTHKLLYPDKWTEFDLSCFDYVLFVDDEITTGNTILNFIRAYKDRYGAAKFGIASICNWQDKEHADTFSSLGIDVFSLIHGQIKDVSAKMCLDGMRTNVFNAQYRAPATSTRVIPVTVSMFDERFIHTPDRDYTQAFSSIISESDLASAKTVRVIGTEEFMYLPIKFAEYLEARKFGVLCHATTRSCIDVSTPSDKNGIYCRDTFGSVYSEDRETYLYNLGEHTDVAYVITDGIISDSTVAQFAQLCNADKIYFVKINWEKI